MHDMKTKTSNLIDKFFNEELNQMPPQQGQTSTQPQTQNPAQQNNQSNSQQEETQKVEIYIPLHDGKFTNRIFSTVKDVNFKVLYDNIEDDMRTMEELENNPSTYHQIDLQ